MSRLTKKVREWRQTQFCELQKRVTDWRRNNFPLPPLTDLLRSHGIPHPKLRYIPQNFCNVTIEKASDRLSIQWGRRGGTPAFRWLVASSRLPVFAKIVQMTSATDLFVRAHLGDRCDETGVMTACSSARGAILIPDPEFYGTGGYAWLRMHAATGQAWRKRSDLILWRGSTTGQAVRSLHHSDDVLHPEMLPRIRMCALLRGVPQIDARIVDIVQENKPAKLAIVLRDAGLMGEYIPQERWIDYKFALDIDGNANTWSNLYRSLLLGCCVIKVTSPRNDRQWYYDRLQSFEHYVPVRADMSDLREQIAWCRDNPEFCERIAANGQRLALSMDLNTELADAARRVERAQ